MARNEPCSRAFGAAACPLTVWNNYKNRNIVTFMPRRRILCGFAPKMIRKPLRFVQRGRILLRCGSAFALSLPSLGVSSLDLGRLFIQAALFSCRCSIIVIPGRVAQTRNLEIPGSLATLAPRNDDRM